MAMIALVMFGDNGPTCCPHRVLTKPGFRQVVTGLHLGGRWYFVGRLSDGRMDRRTLTGPAAARWLASHAVAALTLTIDRPDTVDAALVVHRGHHRPRTCVTCAKRVLGVRAWWVQTPYQLYRFLKMKGATDA